MPTPYFEVAHLTKHFSTDESTVAAIQDVSFSLQKGQFLSILGPSGCGKSTLFNLIAGLMQPDCGDIRLQGESMLLRPGLTGYMLQKICSCRGGRLRITSSSPKHFMARGGKQR